MIANRYVKFRELFKTNSLFRNALYLMSSTGIMALLGFAFWLFVSRLYSASDIGASAALISITILIGGLSMLGLNAAVVRFLASSKDRSRDINAAMIVVAGVTALAALAYILVLGGHLTGHLRFFNDSVLGRGLFSALVVGVSLNTFTDSVFIASRRAEFHTTVYACFGLAKLLVPLGLIPLGSLGIFLGYGAAVVFSLLISLYFMWRYCGYHLLRSPNWGFIRNSRKYTSNNYFAAILSTVPALIMPSLVLARLGGAQAAYFSLAWTMAALLYVAPQAITKSLLAEGANDASARRANLNNAVRLLLVILTPAIAAAILIGPYILRIFGKQYATGSTAIFQLLALSTVSIAIGAIGDTIMNLEHRSRGMVVVQGVTAAVTLALGWLLMSHGLVGVGLAILCGCLAGNIVQFTIIMHRKNLSGPRRKMPTESVHRKILGQYGLAGAGIGHDIGGGDRCATVVVTSGRRRFVLKTYNVSKRSFEQVKAEVEFTRYLSAQGIPTPTIIPNSADSCVTALDTGGSQWVGILMDFESGRQPTSFTPKLLVNMAQTQGKIHNKGAEYAKMLGRQVATVRGRSYLSRLLVFAPRGLSHFDFYSNNILVNGDEVSCALDFEGMRYDPLVVCVLFTLVRLYDEFGDRAALELYLRSYLTVRPMNALEKFVIRATLAMRFGSRKLLSLRY